MTAVLSISALSYATESAINSTENSQPEVDIEYEAKGMIKAEQNRMNMKEFTAEINGNSFFYLDNQNMEAEETLVLLHGFNGDSSHWLRFADYLRKYRVIVPELLGFGRSEKNPALNYQFDSQAEYVSALLNTIDIQEYHLAGNSMGGAIAIVMADKQPAQVKSLTLVSTAGILLYQSPWLIDVFNGKENPLFVQNADDLSQLLDLATEKKPFIPPFLMQYLAQRHADNYELTQKVFEDMSHGEYANVAPYLANIKAPTLILWGKEDQIIDARNADVFDSMLPNSRKIIMEKTGHLAMIERPKKSAEYFIEFLTGNVKE